MDYEIIDLSTNTVVNSIAWDGLNGNPAPDGCIAVPRDMVQGSGIGWTYVDGVFTRPAEPPPPPSPPVPTIEA
jgi:hypothetical protein